MWYWMLKSGLGNDNALDPALVRALPWGRGRFCQCWAPHSPSLRNFILEKFIVIAPAFSQIWWVLPWSWRWESSRTFWIVILGRPRTIIVIAFCSILILQPKYFIEKFSEPPFRLFDHSTWREPLSSFPFTVLRLPLLDTCWGPCVTWEMRQFIFRFITPFSLLY